MVLGFEGTDIVVSPSVPAPSVSASASSLGLKQPASPDKISVKQVRLIPP